MKTLLPVLISLLILSACHQENNAQQADATIQSNSIQADELTMHDYRDVQNGLLLSRVPLPSTWSINNHLSSEYPIISGPNNLAIYNIQSMTYIPDPIPDWYSYYDNHPVYQRDVLTMEKLIHEDFENGNDYKLIETTDLPEVAAKLKQFDDQLFKSVEENCNYRVVATDWVNLHGDKMLIILQQYQVERNGKTEWGYNGHRLEVEAPHYENSRNQFIHGLKNVEYAKEWIKDYNKKAVMDYAHQKRMEQFQPVYRPDREKETFAHWLVESDSIYQAVMDEEYSKLEYYPSDYEPQNTEDTASDGQFCKSQSIFKYEWPTENDKAVYDPYEIGNTDGWKEIRNSSTVETENHLQEKKQ